MLLFENNGVYSSNINSNMLKQVVGISILPISFINKSLMNGDVLTVGLLPGKSWFDMHVTSGSIKFTEKSKNDESGVSYTQSCQCNISSNAQEISKQIQQLEKMNLIVKLKYSTGEIKAFGCPEFPARMLADSEVKDSGKYKVDFTCNSIFREFCIIG